MRNILLCVALLLLSVIPVQAADSEKNHIKQGNVYYNEGKLDEAIASFNEAAALNSKNADIYIRRGNAYFHKSQYDQAVLDFTLALDLNPKLIYAYSNRALTYHKKGQYDLAIKDCDMALQINPKFNEAYFVRAIAYYMKKEPGKAWDDLFQAKVYGYDVPSDVMDTFRSSPGLEGIRKECSDKGISYAIEEKLAEAKTEFEKAVFMKPSGPVETCLNVINDTAAKKINNKTAVAVFRGLDYYYNKGEYNNAVFEFNKGIIIEPDYPRLYVLRANAYDEEGRFEEAMADYNKAVKMDPKYANAYFNRGVALAGKEKYDEALADYNKAIQLDPKDANAYFNRGKIYHKRDKTEEALVDYDMAARIDPYLVGPYLGRGSIYDIKREYDKSIYNYTKAIGLGFHNDFTLYYGRGLAYYEKGNYDAAIADFTKTIELSPDYMPAYGKRGFAYARKGDCNRALSDLNTFMEHGYVVDYDADFFAHRGMAYHGLYRSDEAIADFDKVIKIDPYRPLIYASRGTAYGDKGDFGRAVADFTKAIELETASKGQLYYFRAAAYQMLGQYDNAWDDVHKARASGYQVDAEFINKLSRASGREE